MVGLVSIEQLIKIGLAIILGALVGAERKKERKPAGLRTYILVCLGSTLISIVSVDFFGGDPARIAAGVVTGIGFLGAGAIIATKGAVRGLTTAAGLWVIAAVGLAVGAGAYLLATIVAIIMLLVLMIGQIER
jgi:putative Mg2+ transporter-C (MgtC) family protein